MNFECKKHGKDPCDICDVDPMEIFVVTFDPLLMGTGIGGFDWTHDRAEAENRFEQYVGHHDSHVQLWLREAPVEQDRERTTDWLCDHDPKDGELLRDSHPHSSALFRDAAVEFNNARKAFEVATYTELRRLVLLHLPTAASIEVSYETPEIGLMPAVGLTTILDAVRGDLDANELKDDVRWVIEGLIADIFYATGEDESDEVTVDLDDEA